MNTALQNLYEDLREIEFKVHQLGCDIRCLMRRERFMRRECNMRRERKMRRECNMRREHDGHIELNLLGVDSMKYYDDDLLSFGYCDLCLE